MHTGNECFGSKNATHFLHGYHVRLVVKQMQVNEVQRPGTAPHRKTAEKPATYAQVQTQTRSGRGCEAGVR